MLKCKQFLIIGDKNLDKVLSALVPKHKHFLRFSLVNRNFVNGVVKY